MDHCLNASAAISIRAPFDTCICGRIATGTENWMMPDSFLNENIRPHFSPFIPATFKFSASHDGAVAIALYPFSPRLFGNPLNDPKRCKFINRTKSRTRMRFHYQSLKLSCMETLPTTEARIQLSLPPFTR